METSEVSLHQLKVFRFFVGLKGWASSAEVARETGVARRTARAHCLKLVEIGVLDQADVFPGHRYRYSEFAENRCKTYIQRLRNAEEVFGIMTP